MSTQNRSTTSIGRFAPTIVSLLVAPLPAFPAPVALQVDYAIDDCTPDNQIGRAGRGDLWVANAFEAEDGGELIVSVEASFFYTRSWPLGIHIYDDPDNDWIPDDLILLQSVSTTFPGIGACHEFLVPPTEVSGVFFVALSYADTIGSTSQNQDFPFLLDQTRDERRTWYVETSVPGSLDPANLPSPVLRQSDVSNYEGQYLIRATGIPRPVSIVDFEYLPLTRELALQWSTTPSAFYEIRSLSDLGLGAWRALENHRIPPEGATSHTHLHTTSFNDSMGIYAVRRMPPPVVFEDDFEDGATGWVRSTTLWELGVPSNGPFSARSGQSAYGTNLDGNYPAGALTVLTSPAIALPQGPAAAVSFWYIVDLPLDEAWTDDRLVVEVVSSPADPLFSGHQLLQSRAASTWFWKPSMHRLPQSLMGSTSYLRFILADDPRGTIARGAYIDDVVVRPAQPCAPLLRHRYSFGNGASDSAGDADGTLLGNTSVSRGRLQLPGGYNDYVELPAASIQISTYCALTLELWSTQPTWDQDKAAAVYFGDLWSHQHTGKDYVVIATAGSDNTSSGAIAVTSDGDEPWLEETSVAGPELNDGEEHHYALVIDGSQLVYYVDGRPQGTAELGMNFLGGVSTESARVGASTTGNILAGSVNELRLYEGALVPSEIATSFAFGPDASPLSDAGTLESVTLSASSTTLSTGGEGIQTSASADYSHIGGVPITGFDSMVFSSDNSDVVVVSSAGFVTPVTTGTATVWLEWQGVSNSLHFTVVPLAPEHFVSPSGLHQWPFSSWTTAATNIQDAIDASESGHLVWVTNGVYNTGGLQVHGGMANRIAITKPITVRSVNGPNTTFIVGSGPLGNDAVRCSYVGEGARLDGFTLTNGYTRIDDDNNITGGSGAGVWADPTAIVSNCTISGNHAYYGGGGALGGIIQDCAISGNSARFGGGIMLTFDIDINERLGIVRNCVLSGNSAESGGGAAYLATLENCLLVGNSAPSGGGTDNCLIRNCTITQNRATSSGGGVDFCTVQNSIVYGNTADRDPDVRVSTLLYSCTSVDPGGVGNITASPQFVNAGGGNFHLEPSSPCIDSGLNQVWMTEATDLDGNPRVLNSVVDMGAYESP